MTMQKGLQPRNDVDRLYMSRKEGGRGLTGIKNSVDKSIQRLHKKCRGRMITAIRNNTDNTNINT